VTAWPRLALSAAVLIAGVVFAGSLAAQQRIHLSATAAAAVTRIDPAPGGSARAEIGIDLTNLMARAMLAGGRLDLAATLSLEGATMPDGVLTIGAVGEGYVDRRHPHTYVHELIATARQPLGDRGVAELAVTAGKGFVPFGTDDPMSRPTLRYPVNHHWAQILERALVMVGVRVGPAALEAGLFNGDEPERPWQAPNLSRFGDSWALRASGRLLRHVELQFSHAKVASPEHRAGAGPRAVRWSGSARLERPLGRGRAYGLVEWARTEEADGFFAFDALLLEGEIRAGAHRPYYRFERTERPEEERTADPFRTRRPPNDDAILGITRWTILTVGYAVRLPAVRGVALEPLVEVARAGVAAVGSGLFRPAEFYGGDVIWSVTVGLRLQAGPPHRMGRYGVLETDTSAERHREH
jgi:hypothetical protein